MSDAPDIHPSGPALQPVRIGGHPGEPLSPEELRLIRQRLMERFYDTPQVTHAIAESVLGELGWPS
jgi:hypothetical protein